MATIENHEAVTTQHLATALLGWLEQVSPELAKIVAENPVEHVQDVLDMAREVALNS